MTVKHNFFTYKYTNRYIIYIKKILLITLNKAAKMKQKATIEIIGYQPEYAYYFEKLNREWIEESYTIEKVDIQQFQNPEQSIINHGGEIFFAKIGNEIIGTVALKKNHNDFELSKLAVSKSSRGLGGGEMLCRALINKAKALGIKKLVLYSNSRQNAAINLYRKIGFVEVQLEPVPWERANVKMELIITNQLGMETIHDLIESYGTSCNRLTDCLDSIPKDIWNWQPPYKKWTIHQNIIHLADSEAHSYIRFRQFIAEPDSIIKSYNQDLWANKLYYDSQNVDEALETFCLLRRMTYMLLKRISGNYWENSIFHSEFGDIKMWQWLRYAASHTHIFQIQRVYNEWTKNSKANRNENYKMV